MKGFTTGAEEVRQLFDDATALYKEARAELEKGNGNPRDQRPNIRRIIETELYISHAKKLAVVA